MELRCAPAGLPATRIHLDVTRAEIEAALAEPGTFVLADRVVLDRHALARDEVMVLGVRGGEDAKTFATLERVLREMARAGLDRAGAVAAVGGGSIGDLGGLAAALYLRGVRFVQVPTTLLAMIDSSVGGKTAVNLPEGKNLAGAFWPAERVLVHPDFLATIPEEELRSGLGEAIKVGLGLCAELFTFLEEHRKAVMARDPASLREIVRLAVAAKIELVEKDPRETTGERRLLNLGHTLGHALEACSGYAVPHGLAVARGLHFALRLAVRRGAMDDAAAERAHALLTTYGFAETPLPPGSELLPFLARDKKRSAGRIAFVLPTAIGSSRVERLEPAELERAIRA